MLKVAWNEHYAHELPKGHRFPMEKYNLLPQQLMHEGTMERENFFDPSEVSEKRILRIHTREYLDKLLTKSLSRQEERATGFPLSDKLVRRELIITQGTIEAIDYAFQNGVSANIAGGTHHAFRDRGEGFCLLNDIAVGSAYAIEELGVKQILVIDLDVHQGNGTAKIFENDPRVFTFSMHGEKNYPLRKENSDLDIALPDGTEDEHYLKALSETLLDLINKVRPELVFFQSGVDVLESDKLGRLSLSLNGCKKRDEIVFTETKKRSIPVVFNMGGGYSKKISVIIEAHANTYRTAREIYF
ncbi:histone deacetylase [Cryomorphaceae bacterium 1068]|nr:histone deacetylase [Cryomorphaceae bacterium 1068]